MEFFFFCSSFTKGGMCSVFLQDTEKVVSISSEHLEPVTPTKNNKVLLNLWNHFPIY